jgi:hypothetical protein
LRQAAAAIGLDIARYDVPPQLLIDGSDE